MKQIKAQEALRQFEHTAIDLVSAVTPWLAPVIPAAIAFKHMRDPLMFPWWLAFIGAVVIEFLGLSAIHTAVQFWTWNQRKRKSDASAPVAMPVAIGVFYLILVLSVNVILAEWDWKYVTAVTLLSLVSVPAGIVIAIRAQHAAYVEQLAEEKQEQRQARRQAKSPGTRQKVARNTPQGSDNEPEGYTHWRTVPTSMKRQMASMTTSEIEEMHPAISPRTAREWRKRAVELASNGSGHK